MPPILEQERHTLREAARLLGVHTATVWRWTLRGVKGHKLPTFLIGGRRFVLRSDLDALLNRTVAQPEQPIVPSSRPAEDAGAKLDALLTDASKGRSTVAGKRGGQRAGRTAGT